MWISGRKGLGGDFLWASFLFLSFFLSYLILFSLSSWEKMGGPVCKHVYLYVGPPGDWGFRSFGFGVLNVCVYGIYDFLDAMK